MTRVELRCPQRLQAETDQVINPETGVGRKGRDGDGSINDTVK